MRHTLLLAAVCCSFLHAQKKDHTLGYDDTPYLPDGKWRVHDVSRPHPRKVAPGSDNTGAPSDATVLFDGKDLSKWVDGRKPTEPAAWKVENGVLEVAPKTGHIITKEKFGDVQVHLEWQIPADITGKSQSRGNTGIMLMSRYELQILDSLDDLTYADGQAASIYAQYPPLVNACRKAGDWQTYDIVFEAPRFEGEKLLKPAFITLFHNGVLVHNHQQLIGRVRHAALGTYVPHEAEEPILLQNHGSPVRFRNIWVRRLTGYDHQ
jgi:hypothetical protein